jgi:hypothetical protein
MSACRSLQNPAQSDGSELAADTVGKATGDESLQETLPPDAVALSQGIAADHASFLKTFIDLRQRMLDSA